jgi:hypothetical protein
MFQQSVPCENGLGLHLASTQHQLPHVPHVITPSTVCACQVPKGRGEVTASKGVGGEPSHDMKADDATWDNELPFVCLRRGRSF